MKTVFILAFDSGAQGTRYIDEDVSKFGTSDEYLAKFFETKKEAENFTKGKDWFCWIVELEIEA